MMKRTTSVHELADEQTNMTYAELMTLFGTWTARVESSARRRATGIARSRDPSACGFGALAN